MSETALRRKQTYQNIAWFMDLKTRKILDMEPPYQRWSVWNEEYKQQFIETLLMAYPSPAIFMFRRVDETAKTLFEVVDGKQRLTAIFEFVNNEFPLKDTSAITSKRGKYFKDLDKDEKIAFFDYDLSVEYLPTNNEAVINDIFDRLNRNTAKLTPQELRHAKYNGDFISAAEQLANWTWGFGPSSTEDSAESVKAIATGKPRLPIEMPRMAQQSRRQMKDVEIVSTLLLYLEEGVRGYSTKALDEAFSRREQWERKDEIIETYRRVIDAINSLISHSNGPELKSSRLANQADFYSFFAAVADLSKEDRLPSAGDIIERVLTFLDLVEDPDRPITGDYISRYFNAARAASNDPGSMRKAGNGLCLSGNRRNRTKCAAAQYFAAAILIWNAC